MTICPSSLGASDSQDGLARRARTAILLLGRLWREEEGKDMVEYGLLVALISLAAVTALMTLANAFRFFANSVSSAGSTSYSH